MLVISDLHWRADTPSWRREADYSRQVLRPQLGALLDTGEAVCVAGDVFHRSADFEATYDLLSFLIERDARLYAVRGQHDMKYHNETLSETGFNLLAQVGRIVPLDENPIEIEGHTVCGYGWGRELPQCGADILIAHVSVSCGNAVIKGAPSAESFRAKAAKFGTVFTGDNHKRFEIPGLYNAGCFHQQTADLADQPPAAWRVDAAGNVSLWEFPSPEPMVDEAYAMRGEKGTHVAGEEFVKALAEAKSKGGADVFLTILRNAETSVEGAAALLRDTIRLCEEAHT